MDRDPSADFVIIPQRPKTRPITPPRKPPIYVDPAQRDSDPTTSTSTGPATPGGAAAPMTDSPTGSASTKSDPLTPASVSAKELKDLFNYASIDCAAVIRSTNPEAKGATSILTENKDSYLLSPCRVGKHSVRHVVVELCDEILVNTLVLANYELFSSTFRHVRVWVNSVYPPTDAKPWRVLADLDAANSRSPQVFQVTKPVAWARYMKLEFLSQYGAQYFCPVSLLRVHGRTMLEEYKLQQTKAAKQAAAAVASTAAGAAGAGAAETEAGRTAVTLSESRNMTTSDKDKNKDTTPAAPARVKPPQLPDPSTVKISVPDSIWDATGKRAPDASPLPDLSGPALDQPATSSVVQDGLRKNAWSAEPAIPLADVGLVQHPEHVPFLPPKLQLPELIDTAKPAAPSKVVVGTSGSPTSVPVPEPTNVGVANPAMPTPGADASATRSIPPRPIPSLPPPPMEDEQEPPPEDEGIYQTIMKRFALVEANHKLLLQYMEEYAQGINEVIRTNDENQSEHFTRSMMQLSQHVVARLAAIKEELLSLVYEHRATSRRFETATTSSVKALQNQVRALEDRTTSLLRWMIVLGLVLVGALVAPWVKVGLTTLLSASIGSSAAVGESVANFPTAKETARRRVNGYASESVASRARSPVTARSSAGTSSEDLNGSTKRRSSQLRARSRRRGHLAIVMEPSRRLAQSLPSPTRLAPGLLSVPADPTTDDVEELEWVPDPTAVDSLPSSQNSTWKSSDELPPPSTSPPHVVAEDLRRTHSVPDLIAAATTSAAAAGSSPVLSAPGTPLRAKRAAGDGDENGTATGRIATPPVASGQSDASSTAGATLSTSTTAPTAATLANSDQGIPVDGAPSSTVAMDSLNGDAQPPLPAATRAVVLAALESVLESASAATAGGPDASVGPIENASPPPPPAPLLLAAVEMAAPVVPVS
ncbi:hypothetical protein GGF32_009318 [Allomyces javanicus]|nr:hypothetical protein GGF32_009318 [Allomyces javanicus]